MNTLTVDELKEKFVRGEIIGAELSEPIDRMNKLRFFVGQSGYLCYFAKGKSRRGYYVQEYMLDRFARLIEKPDEKDVDVEKFRMIQKYRKLAASATFTNGFIRDCLALPETMKQWVNDGKKNLYGYSVTTGNRIEGKVISLESACKGYSWKEKQFRDALANKTKYHSGTFPLRGYDGSLWVDPRENGDVMAGLSLEYKGCGNGYYYLLINDDNFIGYDID